MTEDQIETHRKSWELEDHWQLRKAFLTFHCDSFPLEKLLCLAQTFVNVETLGVQYSSDVMEEIERLSENIPYLAEYRAIKERRDVESADRKKSRKEAAKQAPKRPKFNNNYGGNHGNNHGNYGNSYGNNQSNNYRNNQGNNYGHSYGNNYGTSYGSSYGANPGSSYGTAHGSNPGTSYGKNREWKSGNPGMNNRMDQRKKW